MKKLLRKDYKLRKSYVVKFKKIFPYKILFKNQILEKNVRAAALFKYKNKSKNIFLNKVVKPCIITGRSRGVLTFLRISRLEFKRKVNNFYLPGWYKIK